jgi:hypothetical protein
MRLFQEAALLLLLCQTSQAFVAPVLVPRLALFGAPEACPKATTAGTAKVALTADCGCDILQETSFSGEPSYRARNEINLREAIRSRSIFSISGESLIMDDIIGDPSSSYLSIVVFLRSLG